MAVTYVPISTTTFSGNSNLAITAIPSTYTDLKLVLSNIISSTGNQLSMKMNNTTTSYAYGSFGTYNSSMAFTYSGTSTFINLAGDFVNLRTSTYSAFDIDILGYTTNTYHTPVYIKGVIPYVGGSQVINTMGAYRDTTPVSRLDIFTNTGTFSGTATLFGIKKA